MNLKEKLTAIFLITRPVNFLITFASVIVASIICLPKGYPEFNVLLAAISAAFTASAGNVINDIFDIEIDKINRPQRQLPSEKISIKKAYIIYVLFILISLILSLIVSARVFIIVLFFGLILIVKQNRCKPLITYTYL